MVQLLQPEFPEFDALPFMQGVQEEEPNERDTSPGLQSSHSADAVVE